MCGIFAVVNDKNNKAAQTVLAGLKKLEYRGYDSWGIAIKTNNDEFLLVEKHVGKIGEAETSLPDGKMAIGHTRWATHGGVTDANAHPHLDCSKKIAVIHNGIVENYFELKEKLLAKGHRFISETDTEVIAHLIEEKLKEQNSSSLRRNIKKAIFDTFNLLIGSNAIGVIDYESETIFSCRNGSPLVVGLDEINSQFFLGSDVPAFLKHTNKVYFLNDGEGIEISKMGLKLFNLKSQKEKKFIFESLDWKLEDAEKNGYPHFLIKEINEQKETITKIASINRTEIDKVSELIKKGYRVIFTGCGSASYCSLAGKYFFANAGIESQIYGSYEFLPFAQFTDNKTVVIAVSQSGETADTLIALRAAKKRGAKIVAIINARGSTMERLADIVLPVGSGPEIAVVSTKAFTAQLVTLYLLSKSASNNYDEGINKIKQIKAVLDEWMDQKLTDRIILLAKTLLSQEHVYTIGKHLNYTAALEFALKIKETAYIHAEPFAAGELKHGVITLIQKQTPCFILASNDEVRGEILSSAAELKARGARTIGIAPFNSNEFDEVILTPDMGELTLLANIIVGQLLGYYLGLGRGADPDKPRNLAKSVTVK